MNQEIIESSLPWETERPAHSYSENVGGIDYYYNIDPARGDLYALTITPEGHTILIGSLGGCVAKAESHLNMKKKAEEKRQKALTFKEK